MQAMPIWRFCAKMKAMATSQDAKERIDAVMARFARDFDRLKEKHMERYRDIMRKIEADRLRALRKEIKG